MTEAEWLACTDPTPMLDFLKASGKLTDRKARLLVVAVCRRMWHLLTDERTRRAVEVAERFADGLANRKELEAAWHLALVASHDGDQEGQASFQKEGSIYCALVAAGGWSLPTDSACRPFVLDQVAKMASCFEQTERALQCAVSDIFGSLPFRPVALDNSWLTPTVLRLAWAAYEGRCLPACTLDPARLAVLSDALEDAGCTDEQVVAHLREPSPHVRGCWVIDLLLGKE